MGEDGSGDLKTPLKQKYFIEITILILERILQMKAYNSTIIKICVKRRMLYFYLKLSWNLAKREEKKFEWEQKSKTKKAENKKKMIGRRNENKEEAKSKQREK